MSKTINEQRYTRGNKLWLGMFITEDNNGINGGKTKPKRDALSYRTKLKVQERDRLKLERDSWK
jgi:hypothetical protein